MGSKTYYDVKGAAEHAEVSTVTVYRWINKGVVTEDGDLVMLPCRIVDGVIQIHEVDLDNHLDALGYEFEPDESDQDDSAES